MRRLLWIACIAALAIALATCLCDYMLIESPDAGVVIRAILTPTVIPAP